jgi:hypothetical protein
MGWDAGGLADWEGAVRVIVNSLPDFLPKTP